MTTPNFAKFLATNNRFKQQERAAQIELSTCIQHSPLCQDVVHYLVHATRLADEQRQSEDGKVEQHLLELKRQVEEVESVVRSREPNIKTLLLTVDGNLQAARQSWIQSRDALDQRCKELSDEISRAFSVYNQLGEPPEVEDKPQPAATQFRPRESSALNVIDQELQRIGYPTNGWPREVHDSFFALWLNSKHANRRKFVESIASKFPEYTIGALLRHDDFCYQAEELLQRKKVEIKKWRAQREQATKSVEQEVLLSKQPEVRKEDELKIQRLAMWREQKAMAAEDEFGFELREQLIRAREARIARERASKAAREREEKLLAEKRLLEEEIIENEAEMRSRDINRREGVVSERERLKMQQETQMLEAELENLKQLELKREQDELSRQQMMEKRQRAANKLERQIIGDNIVPDFNRLIQPTSAQQARIREVKEKKEAGGRFGTVNIGYDPFAVVPIPGGRAGAKW